MILSLGLVSCSTDENADEEQTNSSKDLKEFTIIGGYGENSSSHAKTRMVLDVSASQYKWNTDDEIYIWAADGTTKYTAKVESGDNNKNSATFKFRAPTDFVPKYVTFVSGGTGGTSTDGKSITISPTQTYAYSSTATISGLPIMAWSAITSTTSGTTTTYSFKLQHQMSFIKFGTMKNLEDNTSPEFKITGSETGTIDPTTGTVTASNDFADQAISANNVIKDNMIAVIPNSTFSIKGGTYNFVQTLTSTKIAAGLIYPLYDRVFDSYYVWDEMLTGGTGYGDYKVYTENTANFNPITSGTASYACKDCPTKQDMMNYLDAGVYWDDGTSTDTPLYTAPDGTRTRYGLWLKKGANTGSSTTTSVKPGTATDEIRTSGKYFFLPAAGGYYTGEYYSAGTLGAYWSADINKGLAWCLFFSAPTTETPNSVYVSPNLNTSNGFSLWCRQ